MIRAWLDTDIVLDYLLKRSPHNKEAQIIWEANRLGHFEAYIAAIVPTNIFYIVHEGKAYKKDLDTTLALIQEILAAVKVCSLNGSILQAALNLNFRDYEDSVQYLSATVAGLDGIVTHNAKDYSKAAIKVYSPAEFVSQLPPITP